jgi:hypothetical protein
VVGVPPGAYQRERGVPREAALAAGWPVGGGTAGVQCGMTGVRAGGHPRPLICPGDCPG